MKTQKYILVSAFLMGMLSVIIGAFGAHTLREQWMLSESSMRIFNTGVSYQFYHTIALLFCGLFYPQVKFINLAQLVKISAIFFLLGIFFFSGSLYLLSTRHYLEIAHWKWIGPLTPIGGLFFILGWILLLVAGLKFRTTDV